MSYYPAFLDLRGKRCLVVGGGDVAAGKARGLLRAGADVTLIAERLGDGVRRLAEGGKVRSVERAYQTADMTGVDLAVAATDDPAVNRQVSADAGAARALVNVVDAPELSSFIAPAVLERGALQVAVSTGGASPSFAVFVRDRLATEIGPEYEAALAVLRLVRERLRADGASLEDRKRILGGLAARVVERVRAKDLGGVDALLRTVFGGDVTLEQLGIDLR